VPPSDPLQLAEAIALYRMGRAAEAESAAARVESRAEPETAARAAFLRGLIADANGDTAGMQFAYARVVSAKGAEALADATELAARIALRTGDPRGGRAEAEQAAVPFRVALHWQHWQQSRPAIWLEQRIFTSGLGAAQQPRKMQCQLGNGSIARSLSAATPGCWLALNLL
jgi:hypothetical protein